MNVVTKIRNSEKFLESNATGMQSFGSKKDFVYTEVKQENIPKQVVSLYLKLLSLGYSISDIVILTAQNKGDYGTKVINQIVQQALQKDKSNAFLSRGDKTFYVEDKVLQTANNYNVKLAFVEEPEPDPDGNIPKPITETQIYNGNTGIIQSIQGKEMIIDFNGKIVVMSLDDFDTLELGYCITYHKSQGDSAKQVIMIAPKAHTYMLNSNLLYVGGTRAKERAFMFGNIVTVNRAIKKKENLIRETFLCDFLKYSEKLINIIKENKEEN